MSLTCESYTDKSIVVRGDTKPHKDKLKELGGRFNPHLRDGNGWIFSKAKEEQVKQYIAGKTAPVSAPIAAYKHYTKKTFFVAYKECRENYRALRNLLGRELYKAQDWTLADLEQRLQAELDE